MNEEDIKEALAKLELSLSKVDGCSDRFCYKTGNRSGMVTNGGCYCVKDFDTRRVLMAFHKFREDIKKGF